MTNMFDANKATMARWYNEMWGRCDSSKVKDCIAPAYLRHDGTGANNTVTPESYAKMVEYGVGGTFIKDFSYIVIGEGDFLGTIGRYLIGEDLQWDWVQLFRVENARLAETWLPGIGGNDLRAHPTPSTSWSGSELPDQDALPMTASKRLVKAWYERLARGEDTSDLLCDKVCSHDISAPSAVFDQRGFERHWRHLMQHDRAANLQLFMMEENDIVFAAGMWALGQDGREWNWVQGFRIDDGKIAETWLPSIGGTDASLRQSADIRWQLEDLPDYAVRLGRDIGYPPVQTA